MNQFDGFRQALVDIALREVGTHEVGGSNLGRRVGEYQAAAGGLPGDAWCAEYVAWCIRSWLADPKLCEVLQIEDPERWRFRSGRAFDLEAWGRQVGASLLPPSAPCKPGDLVIYGFSHCGIVRMDLGVDFEAIEGNTNDDGGREGRDVLLKHRHRSAVRHFVRLLP